jgi:hypothetical protein
VRQWLLLCALVVSVVAMHHVHASPHGEPAHMAHMAAMPTAPDGSSKADAPCEPATGGDHGALHPCPAVLSATGGGPSPAWLMTTVDRPAAAPTAVPVTRPFPPPRPAGRSLLASVCVLRT